MVFKTKSNGGGSTWRRIAEKLTNNALISLTILSVVTGVGIGFSLRSISFSPEAVQIILFPGELFLRMLKMVTLPLIMTSLVTGIGTVDRNSWGKMGSLTVLYYVTTTLVATFTGIFLVSVLQPGDPQLKGTKFFLYDNSSLHRDHHTGQKRQTLSTVDSMMDIMRNVFPPNMLQACFQSTRTVYYNQTVYRKVKKESFPLANSLLINNNNDPLKIIPEITPPDSDNSLVFKQNITLPPELKDGDKNPKNYDYVLIPFIQTKKKLVHVDGLNSLGIIFISCLLGSVFSSQNQNDSLLVKLCIEINEAILKSVSMVMWFCPFGICSLITGKILEIEDLETTANSLFRYMVTVCLGLFVHTFITLMGLYLLVTRKNPVHYFMAVSQALFTALGTASSAATLPITIRCVEDKLHINRRVSRFVLPIGATVNMDGTALYEAVAALFVAQVNDIQLDIGQLLTVSLTATAASIGSASIPGAGLVTMILVLNAVGLPTDDIVLILSVDWLLDRLRTSVNVLGDAYGAGIVDHFCQEKLQHTNNNIVQVRVAGPATILPYNQQPPHQQQESHQQQKLLQTVQQQNNQQQPIQIYSQPQQQLQPNNANAVYVGTNYMTNEYIDYCNQLPAASHSPTKSNSPTQSAAEQFEGAKLIVTKNYLPFFHDKTIFSFKTYKSFI